MKIRAIDLIATNEQKYFNIPIAFLLRKISFIRLFFITTRRKAVLLHLQNFKQDSNMNKIKQTLQYFLIPYSIFLITLLFLVINYEKADLHLMMNGYHTSFLDTFFKYFTETGASIPFIVVILLLFYKFGASFYMLSSLVINVLITNGLKLLFGSPRPSLYFLEKFPEISLPLVEGVKLYTRNGFPSGHTSAVFAFMICIALLVKKRWVSVTCCIIAILVGYSRVYLSQHFTEDILLGSVIGVFSGGFIYSLYLYLMKRHKWLDKSLLSVIKNREK